jgi:regulator of replication initiation timing
MTNPNTTAELYVEVERMRAEIEQLRAQQSMAVEVIDASDELTAENERLRAALTRINQVVRKRTEPHMRAYTHFMRDFDEVRSLCDKTLNQGRTGRAALDELTAENGRLDRQPYLVRATGKCTVYGKLKPR